MDHLKLTYSAHDCFQSCPKRWYWRYHRNLAPLEDAFPLVLGRYYHMGIADVRRQLMFEREIANPTGKGLGPSRANLIPTDNDPGRVAQFLVKLYADYYKDDPLEYVAVEQPFAFWLKKPSELVHQSASYNDSEGTHILPEMREKVPGIIFTGQIDALAIYEDKLWVVESKTASQVDTDYLAKLPLDAQVTAYSLGAMSWLKRKENREIRKRVHSKVAGVIYDVAGKPRRQYRDGESTSSWLERCELDYRANMGGFFIRQRCFREVASKANYVENLLYAAKEIEDNIATGFWPMHTKMCFLKIEVFQFGSYHMLCPYSPLCIAGETDSELLRYKPEEPFQEIVGGIPRPVTIRLS